LSEYRFRLYVNGSTRAGERARANLREICSSRLADGYVLEIIDLASDPERAEADAVVATPTLILLSPSPERRIIGDLSERRLVLRRLGLDD
jgi:circadian clock protein KaiB